MREIVQCQSKCPKTRRTAFGSCPGMNNWQRSGWRACSMSLHSALSTDSTQVFRVGLCSFFFCNRGDFLSFGSSFLWVPPWWLSISLKSWAHKESRDTRVTGGETTSSCVSLPSSRKPATQRICAVEASGSSQGPREGRICKHTATV